MEPSEELNLDLTAEQQRAVLSLLQRYLPDVEVRAYGSRVRRCARPCSDLDLVVFAPRERRPSVYALKEAFDESNLPFRVDVLIWDALPESFRENILKENALLQSARKA